MPCLPWAAPTLFGGTDRLLTRPKGAHTRPLTSHRLDPVGRHRDNPANGTKTQSHSTVGRPRHREWQGGRVGGVGLEGEDVVDKVLLIMLGSSPPRRSIRAGEGGGLGQRQGDGVPRHSRAVVGALCVGLSQWSFAAADAGLRPTPDITRIIVVVVPEAHHEEDDDVRAPEHV